MDFEKLYKEALERAKAGKPLDDIFPELKESEDERIRKDIIHYILYKADGVSEEQEHKWIAYLEKQKEQKPAEWSEEDELMRDTVLNTLERIGDYGTIGMQKDWLKSLRPRSHWKPSEEQMKHLAATIEESNGNPILESLYDDLKKLL